MLDTYFFLLSKIIKGDNYPDAGGTGMTDHFRQNTKIRFVALTEANCHKMQINLAVQILK